jgi:hypothetical protein
MSDKPTNEGRIKMKTPQEICREIGVGDNPLCIKIVTAALAEALSQRTRECGNICDSKRKHFNFSCSVEALTSAMNAILALDKPPLPVWCEHIIWNDPVQGLAQHDWYLTSLAKNACYPWTGTECPICGKPRPVTP